MIANDLNCCYLTRTFEPRTLIPFPHLTGGCPQGMVLFLIVRESFMIPKYLEFRASLPKTDKGKIAKKSLS